MDADRRLSSNYQRSCVVDELSPRDQGLEEPARAVALDLDGILLDGMRYHIEAWHTAFEGIGVTLTDRTLYLLEGIKTRDVVDIVCDENNIRLSALERDRIAHKKKSAYKDLFEVTPLDGAAELLDTVARSGYSIAIVTGTLASSAEETLAKLGFDDRVKYIVSAEADLPGKPDPAPFLRAVELLGVSSSHCLAVDNAPAGVRSATRGGLPCAGVATYLPKSDLLEADVVFDSVRALAQWIDVERRRCGQGPWNLTTSDYHEF
jgi:HAD superfamily hydrolase (TIGR01509 family)